MQTRLILSALLLCGLMSLAWGSSSPYKPPEGGDEWQYITVILKGTDVDKDATGKAVLACNLAETQHRIQLSAAKLIAGGTYSVWLVRLDQDKKEIIKEKRVDNPDRPLEADKNGKLAFVANLASCPGGKYHRVEVRYHPRGRAKDVEHARTALRGDIRM